MNAVRRIGAGFGAIVAAIRLALASVTGQELVLAGIVLLWVGFGPGVAGLALLIVGAGATLDWMERIR